MQMQTSDKGLNVIRSFEGRALRAYPDPIGVWTIGYGITNADKRAVAKIGTIKRGLQITEQQAEELFIDSIRNSYEPSVRSRFSGSSVLTQQVMDSGSSFHFNTGAIAKATWPTALLKGDKSLARTSILSWNKAGGKVLAGLTRRRKREWEIIDVGDYGPEGLSGPVEIGENGRPTGRQLPAPSLAGLPSPAPDAVKVLPPGVLVLGMTGEKVNEVNQLLLDAGRLKAPEFSYTEATKAAVSKFQSENKDLNVDGVVGPATYAQLIRDRDMRAKSVRATKLIGTVGAGTGLLASLGYATLKVALIATGVVGSAALIYIVIAHRTELETLWNALRKKQVP